MARNIDERLADLPGDSEIMILETPLEIAFIRAWREADESGKQRLDKLLAAGVRGELPSVEKIEGMTPAQRDAFIDSLPDART